MAQKQYLTTLKSIQEIAKGTFAVSVTRPAGMKQKAGQFSTLRLAPSGLSDPKGDERTFSIASTPQDEDVTFVFRNTESPFKQQVLKMHNGTKVKIDEPEGEFVLPEASGREIIFLVGGIGITTARGMFRDAVQRKLPHKITLFYSNRTPEETAFLDELQKLSKDQHKVIFTMTKMSDSHMKWDGETTHIDAKMIKKYEPKFTEKQYYIVGPVGFVSAMVKMTRAEKIPFSQVKIESYGVYGKGV